MDSSGVSVQLGRMRTRRVLETRALLSTFVMWCFMVASVPDGWLAFCSQVLPHDVCILTDLALFIAAFTHHPIISRSVGSGLFWPHNRSL